MGVTSNFLFLLVFLTREAEALVSNTTEDVCSHFKECWQCVGDPCSRTNEAERTNDICVWCNNYPRVGKTCVSSIRDRVCLPFPMKYTYQCSDPTARVVSKDASRNCQPLVARDFVVHLEQLSEDVQGVIVAITGIQNFRVWIGLCRYVNSSEVLQKCGQHAPIEMIEIDSRLTTATTWTSDRCWNVGEMSTMSPVFVDETNPESGILLHYGSTPCCAGNLSYSNVTVVLKPGWCQGGIMKTNVTAGNVRVLTNCSARLPLSQLLIEVNSSFLCQNNVEWRLSTTKSTVLCNESDTDHLHCTIGLFPQASGRKTTSSFKYCQQRFQLWITYVNNSEVNTSISRITRAEESCRFVLNSSDISTLSVVYSYPTALPQLLPINGKTSLLLHSPRSDEGEHTKWYVYVAAGVSTMVVVVVITAILYTVRVKICAKVRNGYDSLPGKSQVSESKGSRSNSQSNFGSGVANLTSSRITTPVEFFSPGTSTATHTTGTTGESGPMFSISSGNGQSSNCTGNTNSSSSVVRDDQGMFTALPATQRPSSELSDLSAGQHRPTSGNSSDSGMADDGNQRARGQGSITTNIQGCNTVVFGSNNTFNVNVNVNDGHGCPCPSENTAGDCDHPETETTANRDI